MALYVSYALARIHCDEGAQLRRELVQRGRERAASRTPQHYAAAMVAVMDEFEGERRCWSFEREYIHSDRDIWLVNQHKNIPLSIYTPDHEMRSLSVLIRAMWHDLKASRELAWRLFVRDTSARYRQSLLGIFWTVLNPLVTGTVFILLNSKGVINVGETDIPYPVFAFVGIMLWQVFVESLRAPLGAVNAAKSLLAKINFPREALLVAAFYGIVFDLFSKLIILGIILVYFGIPVTWGLALAPIAILAIILLGMTIGLFLTPLGMLYTDINSGLGLVTQFWFFATPAIYPAPETFPYSLLATLNPVAPLLIGARDLMTKGALHNIQPFLGVCALTVAGLFGCWILYRIAMPIITERMSA